MTDLVIADLYPGLLRTYGDRDNVVVLARRAEWRGFSVRIDEVGRGEAIPADVNVIVLGGGTDSVQQIPLDRFPGFHFGIWPFFDLIIRVFAELLKVSLAIAGPAFIASFITDLALGMINRVAPQVQVYFISMQIKPVVVTVMILVSIHLVIARLQVEFRHMLELLGQTLRLLA